MSEPPKTPAWKRWLAVIYLAAASSLPAAPDQLDLPSTIWQPEHLVQNGEKDVQILGHPAPLPGGGLTFNGKSDGLILAENPLKGFREFTIEVCFRPDSHGPTEQRFLHIEDDQKSRVLMEIRLDASGRWALDTFLLGRKARLALLDRTLTHDSDRWHWVALVFKDGQMSHFTDGKMELSGPVEFDPMIEGRISLGVRQNRVHWFQGGIREVRIHPVALPGTELQSID